MDGSERSSFTDFLNTIQNYEDGGDDDDDESYEDDGEDDGGDDSFEEAPDETENGEDGEEDGSEEEFEEDDEEDEEDETEYEEDGDGDDAEGDEDEEDDDDDHDHDENNDNGKDEEEEDAEEYEEDDDDAADDSDEYDSDDASELPPASHVDTTKSASEIFGDEETEFEDDDEEEEDQEGDGQEDDDDNDEEDEDSEDENEEEDEDDENDENEDEEEDQSTLDSENINDSDADDDNDEHDFKDEDDDSDDDFKDEGDTGNDDDNDDDEDDSSNEMDDSDTNDSDSDSDDEDEDDSGHQDFDEDLQLNSFLAGAEGLDSADYNDDFPDEFDPWAKEAAETSPSEMRNGTKQREQRGRGRIVKIPLPKGRSSRLFLLVVVALLCIGALVLILYFAGVGPFGTEDAALAADKTKPPTKAPSSPVSPSPAPTITTSPSAFTIDPDALEIAVKPNYQAIVPSGMTTNVTIQSLSLDLIARMDALAPDVLFALESSGEKRMLRERRRNLQSYSVKLPTSIDEIYEIDCPALAAADSLCVDVLANVILLYEQNNTEFVEDYQEALELALDNGQLEEKSEEIDSDLEIIVFGVGPTPSPPPSASSQPTVSSQPTGSSVIGSPAPSNIPTPSPDSSVSRVPSSETSSVSPSAKGSTIVPTLGSTSPTTMATAPPTVTPIRFFVIAGDSNVVGFADLNHLLSLSFLDPAYARFVTSSFAPVERPDATVTFNQEYAKRVAKVEGKLSTQYGTDGAHFGPEVGMGFNLADEIDENIVIVKGCGIGGSLAEEWLPPSSGGPGSYYTQLVGDIKDAMGRVTELGGISGQPAEFAGMVWFHGYDDAFNNAFRGAYGTNLRNLIKDIRTEFDLPNLPIVIAELGAQGASPDAAEQEMREIQKGVVEGTENTALTVTSTFITGFDTSNPTDVYDSSSNYWGRADVMIQIGYQFAADMLALRGNGAVIL